MVIPLIVGQPTLLKMRPYAICFSAQSYFPHYTILFPPISTQEFILSILSNKFLHMDLHLTVCSLDNTT